MVDVFVLRKLRRGCKYCFVFVRFDRVDEVERVIIRENGVKLGMK